MKNLIPLTTYVLDKKTPHKLDKIEAFDNIKNYAKFLSMPLELKMFVPCDDEGNALENKNYFNYGRDYVIKTTNEENFLKFEAYYKALSEVIFEGFDFKGNGFYCSKNQVIQQYKKNKFSIFNRVGEDSYTVYIETIEDIVKFNLTLTEQAREKYKF